MTTHKRLMDTAAQLADEELEVLTMVAERLLQGQRQYGLLRLATDQRNFAREALEEMTDGAIYGACALLRDKLRAENLRDKAG